MKVCKEIGAAVGLVLGPLVWFKFFERINWIGFLICIGTGWIIGAVLDGILEAGLSSAKEKERSPIRFQGMSEEADANCTACGVKTLHGILAKTDGLCVNCYNERRTAEPDGLVEAEDPKGPPS